MVKFLDFIVTLVGGGGINLYKLSINDWSFHLNNCNSINYWKENSEMMQLECYWQLHQPHYDVHPDLNTGYSCILNCSTFGRLISVVPKFSLFNLVFSFMALCLFCLTRPKLRHFTHVFAYFSVWLTCHWRLSALGFHYRWTVTFMVLGFDTSLDYTRVILLDL